MDVLQKFLDLNTEDNKKLKEKKESEKTEEKDTDEWIDVSNKKTYAADRRNFFYNDKENRPTKKTNISGYQVTCYNKTTRHKINKEQEKINDNLKLSRCQHECDEVPRKNYGRSRVRGIRKTVSILVTKWEDMKPFLSMDWLWEINRTIQVFENETNETSNQA